MLIMMVWISVIVCAQDTVLLKVTALTKPGITLKLNNDVPLREEGGKLSVPSASWVLSVKTIDNALIRLINDNKDTIKLTTGNLKVDNNKLSGANIIMTGGLQIWITAGNNPTPVKMYVFKYESAIDTTGKKKRDEDKNGAGDGNNGDKPKVYTPGSAILDALYLAGKGNETYKIDILSYYAGGATDPKEISKAYVENRFLNKIVDSIINKPGAQNAMGALSSVFSSIGGLDVTNIADGLARFLVKRTKQELSIAFFERFKKVINETPDLGTLFPKTVSLLNAIDDDVYEYERYIQNLREAFKSDIAMIYTNLPGIIPNHQAFFDKHPEIKSALLTGCYIAEGLQEQTHPGDILANYPIEYLDGLSDDYKGTIQTMQLFSASLRDTVSGKDARYWVEIQKIRELVNNRQALKFYLGFIWQQAVVHYDGVKFTNTSLTELLNKVAENYDKTYNSYDAYKRYIMTFGEKITALNRMIQDNDKPVNDSAALEKYARYFRASVDMLEYCAEARKLPYIKDAVGTLDFSKYPLIAYAVTDLVTAVNRRNYSAAINEAVHIYQLVRTTPAKNDDAAGSTTATQQELSNSKSTLDNLVKYGSFMANVGTAKNSEEVSKAIETAALPVGSSRIKRESPFNVSLNAYPGLFVGHESIQGIKDGRVFNAYGLTAPVGVSISRGHSFLFFGTGEKGWKENKNGWSTSLFISLIDIGAVAAFRFKDDSTAQVPSIQLKNILSPGAFISLGIPKSPLSINFGAQMGPNLRKINYSNPTEPFNEYGEKIYWRFSTSLVVDIPLLNIYTKTRQKP